MELRSQRIANNIQKIKDEERNVKMTNMAILGLVLLIGLVLGSFIMIAVNSANKDSNKAQYSEPVRERQNNQNEETKKASSTYKQAKPKANNPKRENTNESNNQNSWEFTDSYDDKTGDAPAFRKKGDKTETKKTEVK